jgi:hypothetical protein
MSLTRQNLQQIESKTTKFKNLGFSSNATLSNILGNLDSDLDFPLKLSATFPINNSRLIISNSSIVTSDGANKVISPLKKQVFSDLENMWIDFQLNTISDPSIFEITWPTTNTVGKFRRLALSLNKFGKVLAIFSGEAVSQSSLQDPGPLFSRDGYPLGYLDLECTNSLGKFKTAGESLNVISNSGIYRFQAGGGGGGSGTEAQLIDADPVVASDVENLNVVYFNEVTSQYEKANAADVTAKNAIGVYDAENDIVVFKGVVNFSHSEIPYTSLYLSEEIDGGVTLAVTSTIVAYTLNFNKIFVEPSLEESTSSTIVDPNGDKFLLLQPPLIKTLTLESEGGFKYEILVSDAGILSTQTTTNLPSTVFKITKPSGTYARIGVLDDGTLFAQNTTDPSLLIDDYFYILSPNLNQWKFALDDSDNIIMETHANNYYIAANPNTLFEVRQLVSGHGTLGIPVITQSDLIEPQQTSPKDGLSSISVLDSGLADSKVLVSFDDDNVWSSVGSTVGDVKQSALNESSFLSLNGNSWVRADGRNVAGSKFHTITGSATVPTITSLTTIFFIKIN